MAYNMRGFGGFKPSSTNKDKVSFKPSLTKPKGDGLVPIGKGGVMNAIRTLQKEEKQATKGREKAKIRESIASTRKEYNHPIYNQENTVSPMKKDKSLIKAADQIGQKGTDMLKKMFSNTPASRIAHKFRKARKAYKKLKLNKKVTIPKVTNMIKKPKDILLGGLNTSYKTAKTDKTRTRLNFQSTELGQMKASIKKNKKN